LKDRTGDFLYVTSVLSVAKKQKGRIATEGTKDTEFLKDRTGDFLYVTSVLSVAKKQNGGIATEGTEDTGFLKDRTGDFLYVTSVLSVAEQFFLMQANWRIFRRGFTITVQG